MGRYRPDRFDSGSILNTSLKVWASALLPAWLVSFAMNAVIGLPIDQIVPFIRWRLVASAVKVFVNQVIVVCLTGVVAHLVFSRQAGTRIAIGRAIGSGLSRLHVLLAAGAITATIVTAGMTALLIPGIIAQCVLWVVGPVVVGPVVVGPVVVVEEVGALQSLKRSAFLTRERRMTIFVIMMLLGLISMGVGVVSGGIVAVLGRGWVASLAVCATQALATSLACVATVVGYRELRSSVEGLEDPSIAEVFA